MATRQTSAKRISPKATVTDDSETIFKGLPQTWTVNRQTLIQIFGVTTGQFKPLADAGVAVRSEKKGYYLLLESMRRYGAFMSEEVLAPEDQAKYGEKLNSSQERARLMRAQRERTEIQTRQMVEKGLSIDAMNDFCLAVALAIRRAITDLPARLVVAQGITGSEAARVKQLFEREAEQILGLVLSRFDGVVSGIAEKVDEASRSDEEVDA